MFPYMMPRSSFSKEEERRVERQEGMKELWRKFTQEPMPLPIWMWNSIVLLINLAVALFVLWLGVFLVAVVLGIAFGI